MDRMIQFAERIIRKVDEIMRNRFIVAVMLFYQGLNMVLHPERAPEDSARGLATTAIVSSLLFFASALFEKGHPLTVRKVLGTLALLAGGIYCYFEPSFLAAYFRYAIFSFVFFLALANMADQLHIKKLIAQEKRLRDGIRNTFLPEVSDTVSDELKKNLKESIQKSVNPALSLLKRWKGITGKTWVVPVLLMLLAVLLLLYPFHTNAALTLIGGTVMLVTSASQIIMMISLYRAKRRESREDGQTDEGAAEAPGTSETAEKEKQEGTPDPLIDTEGAKGS